MIAPQIGVASRDLEALDDAPLFTREWADATPGRLICSLAMPRSVPIELLSFRRTFALLMVLVAVPSAGLTGLGVVAILNERAAVEKRLASVWQDRLDTLTTRFRHGPGREHRTWADGGVRVVAPSGLPLSGPRFRLSRDVLESPDTAWSPPSPRSGASCRSSPSGPASSASPGRPVRCSSWRCGRGGGAGGRAHPRRAGAAARPERAGPPGQGRAGPLRADAGAAGASRAGGEVHRRGPGGQERPRGDRRWPSGRCPRRFRTSGWRACPRPGTRWRAPPRATGWSTPCCWAAST